MTITVNVYCPHPAIGDTTGARHLIQMVPDPNELDMLICPDANCDSKPVMLDISIPEV